MPKSKVALSAAVVLFANFAFAADGKFPKLDLQKHCQNRAKASQEMMGDKVVSAAFFNQCLKSEREAETALVAAWKDIPPNYRALCIKPENFSPSYMEWIACLETNMDMKKLRSKTSAQPAATPR
jgi:hypothetical protein